MTRIVQSGGRAPLYHLKITLKWSKPPIWRRSWVWLALGVAELTKFSLLVLVVLGYLVGDERW